MAAVYTKRLVDVYNFAPAGIIDLGTPPLGTKWVIKSMVASQTGAGYYPLNGFRISDTSLVPIWVMEHPWVLQGLSYHWEGTQAIEYGEHFFVQSLDPGWSLRVTGHELTLP